MDTRQHTQILLCYSKRPLSTQFEGHVWISILLIVGWADSHLIRWKLTTRSHMLNYVATHMHSLANLNTCIQLQVCEQSPTQLCEQHKDRHPNT